MQETQETLVQSPGQEDSPGANIKYMISVTCKQQWNGG